MSTELVGIELKLKGYEGVMADMRALDTMLNGFRGRKNKIAIEADVAKTKKEILALQGQLVALREEQSKFSKNSDEWKAVQNRIEQTNTKIKESRQRVNELQYALRNLTSSSFMQTFNKISSVMARFGSAAQSAGNALTRMTTPFANFTKGIVMGAGYQALNKMTEGLQSGFERYDTIKTYNRMMEEYETATYKAEDSTKALIASVKGMPTGLDEISSLAQRYTLSLGDMERGTQLAIATNNAFLASMSTESQRYQGMMQLQDLMNGKDLNSREWMSLGSSMGKAINEIGLELGYGKDQLGEFRKELYAGNIATEDFMDALIKVGTGEGSLAKLAGNAKKTWDAVSSNVRNAFARMGEGVLGTLDEIVAKYTEFETAPELLADKLNRIDDITADMQKWMRGHSDEIVGFFKSLSEIDFVSIAKGAGQAVLEIARLIEAFSGIAGGKDLSWIGRWMIRGNIIGNALTIFGGLLKGSRGIGGFFGAGAVTIIKKLTRGLSGKGLFSKLATVFGNKKAIESAGDAAKSVPSVAGTFKNAFSALEGLITASGAVALVSGAGFIAFKSVKSMLKDLEEIGNILEGMTWMDAIHAAQITTGIGAFIGVFQYIGTALGPQGLLATAIASAASFLVAGSFAADMWAIKKGVQQINETILALDEVATSITNMQGIGTLSEATKGKIRATIDAINEIKNMFVGKNGSKMDRGQVELGLPTFSIGKVTALTNISNAIHQMQSIVAEFNALSALTVNDPTQVVTDIKNACNQLNGIRTPKGLAKQTEVIAESLIQVRRMAYHINKLAGTAVDVGGFASAVQNIKDAIAELKGMNQTVTLDIKLVMGSGFDSSLKGVTKQLKNAKKDIEAYKKPISFIVPVNVTFSVVTNAAAAIAKMKNERARVVNARNNIRTPMTVSTGGRASRNGLLYRSGGGSIFRPRGTDKIPAMLTEGEYVQKKQAVDFFGLDFMRKVNNMDVRGAMNELLHRAGTSIGVGRQSILNHTVNNNQRITQNINTNNPNFAGARMGRFVGAL